MMLWMVASYCLIRNLEALGLVNHASESPSRLEGNDYRPNGIDVDAIGTLESNPQALMVE